MTNQFTRSQILTVIRENVVLLLTFKTVFTSSGCVLVVKLIRIYRKNIQTLYFTFFRDEKLNHTQTLIDFNTNLQKH